MTQENQNVELRPEDLIGDPNNPNTPSQILEALVNKAIDTGSLRPMGQALGGIQAQTDTVFSMLQRSMQSFGQALGTNSMQIDTIRLAFLALINLLIKKDVFTEDEWNEVYQKDVQQKMEEHLEAARKKHMEAMEGSTEERVDEQVGITEQELTEEEKAEESGAQNE